MFTTWSRSIGDTIELSSAGPRRFLRISIAKNRNIDLIVGEWLASLRIPEELKTVIDEKLKESSKRYWEIVESLEIEVFRAVNLTFGVGSF